MQTLVSTGLIGISLGTQYAMIAIGFTLIFGIMGVINFMHGGGYVLGGYLAFTLANIVGLPFWLAVLGAAAGTAIIGYIIEVLFVDKYVNDHTASMLITLGIYMIMTTVIIVIFGPEPVSGFKFPIRGSSARLRVLCPLFQHSRPGSVRIGDRRHVLDDLPHPVWHHAAGDGGRSRLRDGAGHSARSHVPDSFRSCDGAGGADGRSRDPNPNTGA